MFRLVKNFAKSVKAVNSRLFVILPMSRTYGFTSYAL